MRDGSGSNLQSVRKNHCFSNCLLVLHRAFRLHSGGKTGPRGAGNRSLFMNAITSLEAQHHALAAMMLRLINLVEGFQGPDQALPVTVHLAKLAHLLRLHLTTEDEWLYPAMIASGEPLAASLALAYRNEVGGVAEDVEAFLARWNSSTVIGLRFEHFRQELFCLFHKLEDRIGREDDELYPLARSLGIGIRPMAA